MKPGEDFRISAYDASFSLDPEEIQKGEANPCDLISCHGKRKSTCHNIDERFKLGFTPLHVAAEKGFVIILKVLLNKVLESNSHIDHTDTYKRTPFHVACEQGHTQVVKLLLERGADIHLIDDTYKGPALHIACIKGHAHIVGLLLNHRIDINHCSTDEKKHTALHIACRKGHEQIVKLLLEHKADVMKRDNDGLNPLDVAVEEGQKNSAMAIVNGEKWEDALRNLTGLGKCNGDKRILFCCNRRKRNNLKVNDASNGSDDIKDAVARKHFTTPMRRIIQKMPDVAEAIFDRCCQSKVSPNDHNYRITYNYEFLEDFDEKWTKKPKYCSRNHCLSILANSPSADLLNHPLASTLLDQKWNKYGQKFYYSNLIVYFLFVILLSSFALTLHSPNSKICMEVSENDNVTFDCFPEGRNGYLSFASVCLIVYCVIMMIREVFQMLLFRLQYLFSFVNYVEVPLFILTIVFTFVSSNQCFCAHPWQWQVGVIAVFLSWIALIFSIRKLPIVGIYVVMFARIFKNFIMVLILAVLLISAFAIPFYMVFYDPQDRAEGIRTPFISPWRTIIKTIIMTEGEYEMDSLLRQNNQMRLSDVQYPVVSFSLIIVFVILMPILFLNLLISLAVDDTQKIRKSADTYTQILKVKFVLYIEVFLRSFAKMLKCSMPDCWFIVKPKQIVYPNHSKNVLRQMSSYINNIIRSYTNQPQITVEDQIKVITKPLSQEVKDLRSSMDQMLAIVNSMNERQGGGGRALEEEWKEKQQN
ncbi:PREDICTED: transient receptor potential cation channel subfamily A member 1 homolog [Amphimedon queenslandica]|uniref:Ion transport domain-containing protein n=2 Tax=Amphimedon queenslandica TaxID=400682 RepID=A0AAN0JNS7_AMPQE|nr:PREDICTED: transient receptor potential cation channel subfamily A member 1 homolog [Amphimedon queenslandica]|eukprot:XP_019858431.1 PREDICTED: transient receptor potential cation channel subfamily A member 1 homolog [Amphimedon queenslandica]